MSLKWAIVIFICSLVALGLASYELYQTLKARQKYSKESKPF